MKHSHFIKSLDEPRILATISAAEAKTTGQIRVMVAKRSHPDPLAAAAKHFKSLGLAKNQRRNSVLIFVAPKSRTFAIYGDAHLHARCGPEFWNAIRDDMTAHMKDSRFTDALVHAITKAGDLLAVHFPRSEPDSPA